MKNNYLLLVTCCFLLISCDPGRQYPDEPVIKFESYSIKDTIEPLLGNPAQILILKISFTDGDGDIGLDAIYTLPPKDNCMDSTCSNIYINATVIKNGYSQELPYNYRIPVITPTGQNKALKGEIDVKLIFIPPYDTAICEIYLVDRKLHRSEIITTPKIAL